VEERTIKLMEVCRMRDTPIMSFINKLDREGREPIDLLDEVENVLGIQCAPVTWPIGMGSRLKGVVHLVTGEVHLYEPGRNFTRQDSTIFAALDDPQVEARIGAEMLAHLRPPDPGILRFGGQQLRRAAAAGFLRAARTLAASARDHHP
jgi:peptide chain release factor 3